jgi:molybdopterin converting factor small subunit
MPLGEVDVDRTDQYLSLKDVRRDLASFWTLTDLAYATGGPARYVRVEETGGRLGLITPLSHNFCEACNRVRLTCTGTLHTCLGRDDASDLRAVIRGGADEAELERAIFAAIGAKPQGHDFQIDGAPGRGPPHVDDRGLTVARVLLFGRLADQAGWRDRSVEAAVAAALRAVLAADDPDLAEALGGPGVQVAVDKAIVRGEAVLTPRPKWPSCRR